ncbi:MAG: magnesium transporter CorA family protein [Proteobacteria bacterium]|nr:magnesium transporter CorA family protein [Pseudomonadota bacterium]
MLNRYKISDDRVTETTEEKSPILVYVSPDEAEKKLLINTYKLDEHTLNSALDPDESSRFEIEPDHFAIIFKRPTNLSGRDQLLFKSTTIGAFLFSDRLIIVMAGDVCLFEGKQFTRVSSLSDIVLRLIFRSIFHFLEHLKVINMISEELEQKINQSMENRYLIHLFTLEKSLVYYLNAINSNNVLIEKIKLNAAKLGLNPEQLELLDDLLIESTQCLRQAEIYSNILASLMDARVSIVSNNLNVLMKTLNIITICIMVPTLVVSVFSMNVNIPLAHLSFAFWIILLLAVGSTIGFLLLWWRRK